MSSKNTELNADVSANPLRGRRLPAIGLTLLSALPLGCKDDNKLHASPQEPAPTFAPQESASPSRAGYSVSPSVEPVAREYSYPIEQPVGQTVARIPLIRAPLVTKDVLLVAAAARPGTEAASEQNGALTQMWLSLYREHPSLMSFGGRYRAFDAAYDTTSDKFLIKVHITNGMDCVDDAARKEMNPEGAQAKVVVGALDVERSSLVLSRKGSQEEFLIKTDLPAVRNAKDLVYTFELNEEQYRAIRELMRSDNHSLNQIPCMWTERNTKAASVTRIAVKRLEDYKSALTNRSIGKDANGFDIISLADTNSVSDSLKMEWSRDLVTEGADALNQLNPSNELEAIGILKKKAETNPDILAKLFTKFKENNYDALKDQFRAAQREVRDSSASFEVIETSKMTDDQARTLNIDKSTSGSASGGFLCFFGGGKSISIGSHRETESINRVVESFQKKSGISLSRVENTNYFIPFQAEVSLVSSGESVTEGKIKNRVTIVNARTLQPLAPIAVDGSTRQVVQFTEKPDFPKEADQNRFQLRRTLQSVSERRFQDYLRIDATAKKINELAGEDIRGSFGNQIDALQLTAVPDFERLNLIYQRDHSMHELIYPTSEPHKPIAPAMKDADAEALLSKYHGHLTNLEALMRDIKVKIEGTPEETRSPKAEQLRKVLLVELNWIEEAKEFYRFIRI